MSSIPVFQVVSYRFHFLTLPPLPGRHGEFCNVYVFCPGQSGSRVFLCFWPDPALRLWIAPFSLRLPGFLGRWVVCSYLQK